MPRFGGLCSSDTETKHPDLVIEMLSTTLVRPPGMRQIFVESGQYTALDRLRADVATFLDLPDDVRTALRRIKPQFFTGGAAIALLFSEIHEGPFPSNDLPISSEECTHLPTITQIFVIPAMQLRLPRITEGGHASGSTVVRGPLWLPPRRRWGGIKCRAGANPPQLPRKRWRVALALHPPYGLLAARD